MKGGKDFKWHLTAIVVVGIWGMTFISTRVLIENGLTPQEIFLLRFLIAYVGIWFISPRTLFCRTWRDEGWMLLAGVTGGSLYFLTENTALEVTLTTNVAFIVCSTPLLTMLERAGHVAVGMRFVVGLGRCGACHFQRQFRAEALPFGRRTLTDGCPLLGFL